MLVVGDRSNIDTYTDAHISISDASASLNDSNLLNDGEAGRKSLVKTTPTTLTLVVWALAFGFPGMFRPSLGSLLASPTVSNTYYYNQNQTLMHMKL